jgi:ATP-binding cassette subfamily B protein RaxB
MVSAAIRATQVTRIIIAHRAETIRSTDRVIHLDPAVDRPLALLRMADARAPSTAAADRPA